MENTDKKVLNKSIMVLLIVVAIFIVALLVAGKKGTKIDNFAETITKQAIVSINGKNLVAGVANTPLEHERGLSGTHSLNGSNGMLFVFEEADEHGFWMKDMKYPIDILWVNENNQIVEIKESISPDTYPQVFKPSVPAKYVLEVMAGWVNQNEVMLGDTIIVTDVDQPKQN